MSKASLELGGGNWGTKDGNLLAYAQGNESSNLVPREFSFTRGSDIAATRINSSGLIEKYRENLLLHSNGFNNWTNSNTTETSGQSGYDGSSDAWLLEKSLASGFIFRSFSGSGVYTLSLYAKAGTLNSVLLLILASGGNGDAYFNLSTGVVDQFGNNAFDAQIEDVGGGWYRCSLIGNYTSISQVRIYPANNQGIADTSGTIYIQDAQVEQGLVATSYLESGATTATSGVADNEPRIDYAGGTASLLLEPSRTNLVGYSEYFEGWSNITNITPTSNYTDSPEGVNNATRLQFTANGFTYYISPQVAGVQYTLSCYAKRNDSGTQNVGFFVNGSGTVDSAWSLTNDWKRFTYTYTASNTSQRGIAGLSGADVSVYGFQIEEGSYPTSYIPTYGTSVTRNQDQASFAYDAATTSWSVFMDVKNWTDVSNSGQFSFSNIADTTNSLFYYGACFGVQKSVGQEYSCGKLSNYEVYNGKFAITYDGVNTVKIYIDGVLRDTITTADTAKTAGIDGGNLYYAGSPASKEIKSLLLFPTTLTDRELVNLTSPYSTYQELVTAEGLTWESPTCTTNSITELQSI